MVLEKRAGACPSVSGQSSDTFASSRPNTTKRLKDGNRPIGVTGHSVKMCDLPAIELSHPVTQLAKPVSSRPEPESAPTFHKRRQPPSPVESFPIAADAWQAEE